jgi:hypothetical protein
MEYENVIQTVLFILESILQNAKQFQHGQFYFYIFYFKIIGHGNPNNNLESHCTKTTVLSQINCYKTAT